jgi:hypothetical protein
MLSDERLREIAAGAHGPLCELFPGHSELLVLRAVAAAARDEALEEAARLAHESETANLSYIAAAIRALKSTAPVDTPQSEG